MAATSCAVKKKSDLGSEGVAKFPPDYGPGWGAKVRLSNDFEDQRGGSREAGIEPAPSGVLTQCAYQQDTPSLPLPRTSSEVFDFLKKLR